MSNKYIYDENEVYKSLIEENYTLINEIMSCTSWTELNELLSIHDPINERFVDGLYLIYKHDTEDYRQIFRTKIKVFYEFENEIPEEKIADIRVTRVLMSTWDLDKGPEKFHII